MAVSLAGMVTPFVLGAGLAWVLFHYTDLFPKKTSLMEAMLFLGALMCITALPMLARIIHFKKLSLSSRSRTSCPGEDVRRELQPGAPAFCPDL